MKKTIGFLLLAGALGGCMKKVDLKDPSNDFASIAVINAAATSTFGATTGYLFVDNVIQNASGIGYRGASSPVYLSVSPGSHKIQFVAATIDSTRFVDLPSENFESQKAYTYVVYDTLTTANRKLRSLRLTDDLTLPGGKDDSTGKVRVLHLAANGPAVDVTFLRTNGAVPDSVTVSNLAYIGNNPNSATLSPFNTTLRFGFAGTYTVKVKLAGTQNVVASGLFAFTTNALKKGIVTVYLAGTSQGQPLTINVVRHYP